MPTRDAWERWVRYAAERMRGSADPFRVPEILERLRQTYGDSVRWATGDDEPSSGRVPVTSIRSTTGAGQELVIPVRAGRSGRGAFVVTRGASEVTQEELRLALQIQPLLVLLERLSSSVAGAGDPLARSSGRVSDLTARQRMVLSLLCQGFTQDAIGRRLGCSQRTVEKHLEQIYRTLGVHDRLAAIRCAEDGRPG